MKKHDNFRINLFFVIVLVVASIVLYRLFFVSYVRHSAYSRTATAQNENISNVLARGNIYLNDPSLIPGGVNKQTDNSAGNFLLATNKKFPLAYIVPLKVDWSNDDSISKITTILKIDRDSLLKTIATKQNFSKVLARRLSFEQVQNIKDLNLKGLGISYETDRYYPNEGLAASVAGFLGYDSQGRSGQYGIEAYYDNELFGKQPVQNSGRIKKLFSHLKSFDITGVGQWFSGKDEKSGDTFDQPMDVVLTLDKNIQTHIEEKLQGLLSQWSAVGGTIIVQEPNSGKILAMADRPSFNPNSYSDSSPELFTNKSVQGIFEPGSSFKPITMAIGLDLEKVSPETTFTDTGSIQSGQYTIKNFSDSIFGFQTMSQVLEKSINTGAMFIENQVGDDNFLNYIINMGFGQKTGIDLPGEVSGDINNLYSGRKVNYLTASFGQGIAVTPLQLVNAYSAIANGGKLMKPYVVEKIIKNGGVQEVTKPEIVSIPISAKTSAKLKTMLVRVVDNGFDKARIKGYDVAGKTGTAQIPNAKGGYEEKEFIHDFLGFAPAFDPKFVILIKMDRPQGIQFAADSLSPTFKEIAQFLINYYKIPPSRH